MQFVNAVIHNRCSRGVDVTAERFFPCRGLVKVETNRVGLAHCQLLHCGGHQEIQSAMLRADERVGKMRMVRGRRRDSSSVKAARQPIGDGTSTEIPRVGRAGIHRGLPKPLFEKTMKVMVSAARHHSVAKHQWRNKMAVHAQRSVLEAE